MQQRAAAAGARVPNARRAIEAARRGLRSPEDQSTYPPVSASLGMYAITKASLMHLTRVLAVELAPHVRVNAVAPAVIRTEFARALWEDNESDVSAGYPLGRLGEPDDVAGAVAYLVSADAGWVTGQILTIDGGLLTAGGIA